MFAHGVDSIAALTDGCCHVITPHRYDLIKAEELNEMTRMYSNNFYTTY